MILDKLKRFVRGIDSPTESGSPRDGAFSYAAETHAFCWGVGLAFGLVLAYRFVPSLVAPIGMSLATLLVYAYSDRHERAKAAQVPVEVVKQAEKEPHYLSGGVVVGLLLGGLVVLGGPVLALWV